MFAQTLRCAYVSRSTLRIRWSSTSPTTVADAHLKQVTKEGPKSEEKGGIPWGLIIPLGIFGGIVGYFYRGHKNTKNEAAYRTALKDNLAIAPEELAQIRESNKLTIPIFNELAKRAQSTYTIENINLTQFLDKFCVDQLGGEFQARGSLKAHHLLERIAKKVGNDVDLDTALLVLSMSLLADPNDVLRALFPVFKDEHDGITYERLVQIVSKLEQTDQLPVRVLVKTHNEYPLNSFSKATAEDIAVKGLEALNPKEKDKAMAEFVQERKKTPLSEQEFIDFLLSTQVCVWGACWNKRN